MLNYVHAVLSSDEFVFQNKKKTGISVSKSFDLEKNLMPDLNPNCLQRFSADNNRRLLIILFKH